MIGPNPSPSRAAFEHLENHLHLSYMYIDSHQSQEISLHVLCPGHLLNDQIHQMQPHCYPYCSCSKPRVELQYQCSKFVLPFFHATRQEFHQRDSRADGVELLIQTCTIGDNLISVLPSLYGVHAITIYSTLSIDI